MGNAKLMIPTSNEAKRIAFLMHRRPDTDWGEKEIKKFRPISKTPNFEADLSLIERYYAAERKKGDRGMHRRDLQTLLNNWPSELDRARQWEYKQPSAPRAKLQKPLPGELPEEMRQRNLVEIQKIIGQIRDKFRSPAVAVTEVEIGLEQKRMTA